MLARGPEDSPMGQTGANSEILFFDRSGREPPPR